MAAKRGRTWERDETLVLLEIWGDTNIQERLKSCNRKKPIWEEISLHLKASGFEDRENDACKTRIHTLIPAYRRYKDSCSKTGNGKPKAKVAFFDELDAILSEKPCTRPSFVVNSLQNETANEDEQEQDLEEHANDEVEPERNEEEEVDQEVCVVEEKDENTAAEENYTPRKKKRRTTNDMVLTKMSEVMTGFMEYQREADAAFLKAERERQRLEDEKEEKRRKEDQEFLLRLASILKK